MTRKPLPIGQQIAIARKAAGLTQMDLALRAGLTQGRLSEIERGDRPGITVALLCRIAEALGLSMIFDGDGARLIDPAKIDGG